MGPKKKLLTRVHFGLHNCDHYFCYHYFYDHYICDLFYLISNFEILLAERWRYNLCTSRNNPFWNHSRQIWYPFYEIRLYKSKSYSLQFSLVHFINRKLSNIQPEVKYLSFFSSMIYILG